MNEPDDEHVQEIRQQIGTVMLGMGAVTAVLMFIDHSGLNILTMPAFWYRSASLHLPICIAFFAGGILLLRNQPQTAECESDRGRRTATSEPLFGSLRFYSRDHCPLCDEAFEVLEKYAEFLPPPEFVDIATDHQLEEKYGECIPVVEIDGRVRFRGEVDPVLLERLISARKLRDDMPEKEGSL